MFNDLVVYNVLYQSINLYQNRKVSYSCKDQTDLTDFVTSDSLAFDKTSTAYDLQRVQCETVLCLYIYQGRDTLTLAVWV